MKSLPIYRKLTIIIRALRVHQYAKNTLIFVPLLLSAQYSDTLSIINALWAFIAFSLLTSSVYLINDYFDLATDRTHPIKKQRPLASGDLSITQGLSIALLLLALSLTLITLQINTLIPYFIGYVGLNLCYSYRLKKVILLDVFILAALFMLRIIIGAVAIDVSVSFWLLAFAIFFFLSLALLKRYCELLNTTATQVSGRGYQVSDASLIAVKGIAAAFTSLVIMMFYINSTVADETYHTPELIWLIVPLLLYWVCYLWLNAHRGKMLEDAVYFAIKDKVSYLIAAAVFTLLLLAK